MNNDIEKCISRYRPFQWNGLTWYPITIEYWEEFEQFSNVLRIMQQSMDIKYLSLTYLRMLVQVDLDTIILGKNRSNLVLNLFKLLCLSLKLDYKVYEREEIDFSTVPIRLIEDDNKQLYLLIRQEDKEVKISELEFIRLRELIAKANDIDIPDEATNLELMEWEREKAKENAKDLMLDFKYVIGGVAAYQGKRESDYYDYSILEFNNLSNSINRLINNGIYSLADMSGLVKFEKGNPYPSWCYPKKRELVEVENADSISRKQSLL